MQPDWVTARVGDCKVQAIGVYVRQRDQLQRVARTAAGHLPRQRGARDFYYLNEATLPCAVERGTEAGMIYTENGGAVFRGAVVGSLEEVWDEARHEWKRYGGGVPLPVGGSRQINEDEALRLIEDMGAPPRTIGEAIELDPWKFDGYDGPRDYPKPSPLAHLDLRSRRKVEQGTSSNKDYDVVA